MATSYDQQLIERKVPQDNLVLCLIPFPNSGALQRYSPENSLKPVNHPIFDQNSLMFYQEKNLTDWVRSIVVGSDQIRGMWTVWLWTVIKKMFVHPAWVLRSFIGKFYSKFNQDVYYKGFGIKLSFRSTIVWIMIRKSDDVTFVNCIFSRI